MTGSKSMNAVVAAALSLAFPAIGCAAAQGPEGTNDTKFNQSQDIKRSPADLQLTKLSIVSQASTHKFEVEIAQSTDEQAKGLMFRRDLAPDAGMIFPFAQDRIASFWMKNTVISLDIIFIRRDGTIESIAANTTPYSLDPVASGEPVAAVLEIAAGRAAELGLGVGDTVSW